LVTPVPVRRPVYRQRHALAVRLTKLSPNVRGLTQRSCDSSACEQTVERFSQAIRRFWPAALFPGVEVIERVSRERPDFQ